MYMAALPLSDDERLDGLLLRIQNGDTGALSELYKETSSGVYSFALSILKNREDAEDVLQEVFMAVFRSARLYRPHSNPKAWLMTLTKNFAIDALRKRKRRSSIDLTQTADFSDILGIEDRMVINECLNTLSDEERNIVVLHAVTGLKFREIAQILELPIGTVSGKYNRSLKKLEEALRKGGVLE